MIDGYMTFKELKDAITKAEKELGANDNDICYVNVWETIEINGKNRILIDLSPKDPEEICFIANM